MILPRCPPFLSRETEDTLVRSSPPRCAPRLIQRTGLEIFEDVPQIGDIAFEVRVMMNLLYHPSHRNNGERSGIVASADRAVHTREPDLLQYLCSLILRMPFPERWRKRCAVFIQCQPTVNTIFRGITLEPHTQSHDEAADPPT